MFRSARAPCAACLALVLTLGRVPAAVAATPESNEPPSPTGVAESRPPQTYDDRVLGSTSFDSQYQLWFGDDRREPQYLRAGLEMGALLGVGTGYYWLWPAANRKDWVFPDFAGKVTHPAVTFDNNMHRTNHILHPVGGAMYYWFSRVNGLDIYESSAYAFVSSAFFEFFLEFRETASINDMIFTPAGGISGGEFFFHLGDYLNSARGHDNAAQRAFAVTLGLPQYVHESWDGVTRAPDATPDNLGFSSAYWHRFVIGYGYAAVNNELGHNAELNDLLLDMELVAIPGFRRPGHIDLGFQQGNFTELRLRTTLGQGALADVDLTVNSTLVGLYHQDYRGSDDDLRGHAWMIGASVDMRYVDRWLLGRRDLFAVSHLVGPTAKVWSSLGAGFAVHAEGDVHLDFTGMGSPTYQEWIAQNGPSGTKSVLQMHDYYLGIGGSARAAGALGYRGIDLGGRAAYGTYRSLDGLDQDQPHVVNDVANIDQILELGASLRFSPASAPIDVGLGWDEMRHASRMGPYSAEWRDRRLFGAAAMRF